MSNQIEYEYEGEKIWYSRSTNDWRWRGSKHGFATPDKAEASIDRANGAGKNNAPKFERRPAFLWEHGWRRWGEIKKVLVEVTSQDGDEFWVTTVESKERSKKGAYELFACTPENDAKFEEYCRVYREEAKLQAQRDAMQDGAQRFGDWLKEQEKTQ